MKEKKKKQKDTKKDIKDIYYDFPLFLKPPNPKEIPFPPIMFVINNKLKYS